MKIPTEQLTNSLEHRYGGNGWAVVDMHDGEWADCVYIGKGEVGGQIFRLWSKLIKPEKLRVNKGTVERPNWITSNDNIPIHHTLLPKIEDVRAKLASGEYVVKNTRLVSAA